jgi:hypothetical protein
VRNPEIVGEGVRFVWNDLRALAGAYAHDVPLIFIAGLPKSGTTWLSTMLAEVPGYNLRPVRDPDGALPNHDVTDAVFDSVPSWSYTVLKLHTRCTPENLRVIDRHVDRFLVMYRDLRDVAISRYEHVKVNREHRHSPLYNEASPQDGLAHSIEVVIEHYVPWIRDWLETAATRPDTIMTLNYEDLLSRTRSVLLDVFEFFELSEHASLVEDLVDTKIDEERNLKQERERSVGGRVVSTARKGRSGQWRDVFTKAHRELFKRKAGKALVEFGYEDVEDW